MNDISFIYNFDYALIYILCVHFKFLLLYIDLISPLKVRPLNYRCLTTSGRESLPKCFRGRVWFISITSINRDYNIYVSKHSWNKIFCSPNNHQNGSSLVIVFFQPENWDPISHTHVVCGVTIAKNLRWDEHILM